METIMCFSCSGKLNHPMETNTDMGKKHANSTQIITGFAWECADTCWLLSLDVWIFQAGRCNVINLILGGWHVLETQQMENMTSLLKQTEGRWKARDMSWRPE